jgi:hypothetical protein
MEGSSIPGRALLLAACASETDCRTARFRAFSRRIENSSSSLIRAGLALLFAALTAAAQAQTFPSKPIRLICPFPPGGAVDIASRAIAAEMSKTLGQPVAALVSLSNVLVVNPGRSRPRNHTLGAGGQAFGCDGKLSILST